MIKSRYERHILSYPPGIGPLTQWLKQVLLILQQLLIQFSYMLCSCLISHTFKLVNLHLIPFTNVLLIIHLPRLRVLLGLVSVVEVPLPSLLPQLLLVHAVVQSIVNLCVSPPIRAHLHVLMLFREEHFHSIPDVYYCFLQVWFLRNLLCLRENDDQGQHEYDQRLHNIFHYFFNIINNYNIILMQFIIYY